MGETSSAPNTESLEHNVNIAWDVAHEVKPIMDSAIASEKRAAELESKIQPYDGDDDLTFEENERFNQELMDEVIDSREFAATQRKDAKELAEIYAQDYHNEEVLSEDREDNHEKSTPEQAQKLLDQIDRILVNTQELPGIKSLKNHSGPTKIKWHNGYLFIRDTQGNNHVDDSTSIRLGSVSWDDDIKRTSYVIELSITEGLNVTRQTYDLTGKKMQLGSSALDYDDELEIAKNDFAVAVADQSRRIEETSVGLNLTTCDEVQEIIDKLSTIDSAPKS